MEQRAPGTLRVWTEPFTTLRVPKLLNLRTDPYERADITSNTYYDWALERAYLFVPAQDYVGQFLSTFKDYPPRQKAASFNMDDVLSKMKESGGGPRIERPGAPPAACGRPLVAVAQKTGGVRSKSRRVSPPIAAYTVAIRNGRIRRASSMRNARTMPLRDT